MITLFKTLGLYTEEELKQMRDEIRACIDREPDREDIDEYVENGWDDFMDFLKDYDHPVALLGTVRRWNGDYQIADQYHFDDVKDAILKAIHNQDDVEVYEDNDELCVSTYNHDGGSAFQIKRIINEETHTYAKAELIHQVNQKHDKKQRKEKENGNL